METAEQSTRQFAEENDVLKQFMELLNQQNMGEQSQIGRESCRERV